MLFLHETHKVVGAREVEFEAAYREGWMPTLAADDDARLLWYTNHAHGSGMAYNVVTPLVGEATSLIHSVRPAADIVREMAIDAARILNRAEAPLVQG